MKFLHSADIHLDSPLLGLADGLPSDLVRQASRRALEKMISCALEHAVDFVIIAGDLFDGDWRDFSTGLFFASQAGRLHRADIPLILLHGNHDAASTMRKELTLPGSVRVFSHLKAETFVLEKVGVALHGRSFAHAKVLENLIPGYPPPVPGLFNIGVLHTALEGRPGHDPYAPCTLNDLTGKGYQYWALGHVHTRATLCDDPPIHFPGNLQGRHARETGPKGFTMVRVENGPPTLELIPADAVRWEALTLEWPQATPWEEIARRLEAELLALLAGAEGRPLLVRVRLRLPLGLPMGGERRLTDPRTLHAECQAVAAACSDALWIESCRWSPPAASAHSPLSGADEAAEELLSALAAVAAEPETLRQLEQTLATLRGKTPTEAAHVWDSNGEAPFLEELLAEAQELLRSRLVGEGADTP